MSKSFDLIQAKAGARVCTCCGLPARILTFDRQSSLFPIVALVKNGDIEDVKTYTLEGRWLTCSSFMEYDLIMAEGGENE